MHPTDEETTTINWATEAAHRSDKSTYVDETHTLCDSYPPLFRKPLLLPQRAVVQAQVDLVRNGGVTLEDRPVGLNQVKTSISLLTDPPGSGKTVESLAFISLYHHHRLYQPFRDPHASTNLLYMPKRILVPALLVVANSVYNAFLKEIRRFTRLVVLEVRNDAEKRIREEFDNGTIDDYDVILVRNGTTRGRHILGAIREITNDAVFSLVVLDDVDKLAIPSMTKMKSPPGWGATPDGLDSFEMIIPRALFTLYVTASVPTPGNDDAGKTFDKLKRSPVGVICKSNTLRNTLRLQADEKFASKGRQISNPLFFRARNGGLENPHREILGVLGALVPSKEILDMINAHAIKDVVSATGVEGANVLEIFDKLFHQKFHEWEMTEVEKFFLEAVIAHHPEQNVRNPAIKPPPDTIPSSILRLWSKNEKMQWVVPPNFEDGDEAPTITLWSGLSKFDLLRWRLAVIRSRHTKLAPIIERVKNNVSQARCCICQLGNKFQGDKDDDSDADWDSDDGKLFGALTAGADFSVGSLVVAKCCGKMVCESCMPAGMRPQKDKKTGAVVATCPSCKTKLNLPADVVPISREATHNLADTARNLDLLIEKGLTMTDVRPTEAALAAHNEVAKPDAGFKDKKGALAYVLSEVFDVKEFERFHPTVNNMLGGLECDSPPETAYKQRKFIVYANYEGTLTEVIDVVTKSGLRWAKVAGETGTISKIVDRFWLPSEDKNALDVLVLNSLRYCAGLNLQCATHMVAYHRIRDPSIETQVIGRAQRLGRTCPLTVVSLTYKNE